MVCIVTELQLDIIFNTVIIMEQCSADCSTLHGYHSVDRSCHLSKVCRIIGFIKQTHEL